MRLSELHPRITDNELAFDCPKCTKENGWVHKIRITKQAGWNWTGRLVNLTVTPSISADTPPFCKVHFFITNGEIINV